MKTIRSLYLWAIAWLLGVPIGGFVILCTIFFKPKTYDPWVKSSFRFLLKMIGIRVIVKGEEKLDLNRHFIFMANHVSLFDMPVLGGYIPNFIRALEAEEHFHWPLYGTLIRRAGNIPISRKNIHSSIKSFKIAMAKLTEGKSIVLFPEGKRTLTGEIGEFKKLPFFMAKEAGQPIVPMGISGLFSVKSKTSWHLNPGVVKIKFGTIISPEEIMEMSTVELRDFVKQKIMDLTEYP